MSDRDDTPAPSVIAALTRRDGAMSATSRTVGSAITKATRATPKRVAFSLGVTAGLLVSVLFIRLLMLVGAVLTPPLSLGLALTISIAGGLLFSVVFRVDRAFTTLEEVQHLHALELQEREIELQTLANKRLEQAHATYDRAMKLHEQALEIYRKELDSINQQAEQMRQNGMSGPDVESRIKPIRERVLQEHENRTKAINWTPE